MIFYWTGQIEYSSKDSLLREFFYTSSPDLRSEAIEFIGRSLKNSQLVPYQTKKRMRSLWEERLAYIKQVRENSEQLKELSAFGWWFSSGKFPYKWLMEQLTEVLSLGCEIEADYHVMEKLVELASRYPLGVIKCSGLMIEQDKKSWGILHWKDQILKIIETVLANRQRSSSRLARELANRLVSKGYLDFKNLV